MSIDERIAEIACEQLTAHGFNPTTHTVVLGLVADAIRAALADPVLRGWRPIESAPKDGKKVLVWNNGCGHWVASYRFTMRG